jgi:hypothetical protein
VGILMERGITLPRLYLRSTFARIRLPLNLGATFRQEPFLAFLVVLLEREALGRIYI